MGLSSVFGAICFSDDFAFVAINGFSGKLVDDFFSAGIFRHAIKCNLVACFSWMWRH